MQRKMIPGERSGVGPPSHVCATRWAHMHRSPVHLNDDRVKYNKGGSNQSQRTARLLIRNFEIQRNGVVVVQPDRQDRQPLADDHWISPRLESRMRRQTVTATHDRLGLEIGLQIGPTSGERSARKSDPPYVVLRTTRLCQHSRTRQLQRFAHFENPQSRKLMLLAEADKESESGIRTVNG